MLKTHEWKTENFFSLKTLHGGSVSFGDGKKGYIVGVCMVGIFVEHTVEDMYYINS